MKKLHLTFILSLSLLPGFAQINSGLFKTISAIAGMRDRYPIEKVYLQLDKPYYALGDTLRFKAYLLNGDFLKPSIRSGMLYVEMDDANGKMIKRIMVPLTQGIGWGDMALVDKSFPEGSYTLRAYTNWMLNFGEDYVFRQNLYISALTGSTLVKANFKLQSGVEKDKVNASLFLFGLDKSPFRLKDMQVEVTSGKHSLLKDKIITGIDGSLNLSFDADKTAIHDLSITAQEIRKAPDETAPLVIPVLLNRPENTDVQYLPEGGNLVSGITAKVGFKAVSEDGRGLDVSGKVFNGKGQEVASFTSSHKGMGSFELTPALGETYIAKVNLPGGVVKTYPLPAVNGTGTTMRILPKGKDSLEITLNATPDLVAAAATSTYYLFGETRGLVCYTAVISFKDGVVRKTIGKGSFPAGIAHFTLFNQANQPVNERIVYIAHNDNLRITVNADKTAYGIRDSVALAITVKDALGKPVRGSFSVAVTDDSQVRVDSLGNNLISDMLLTSDLKGTVEDPAWYFAGNGTEQAAALDNLLLTQGWIGYDWKAIFNSVIAQPRFPAELKFVVEGRVTNIFNKGVEKSDVLLFSQKPEMVKQIVTDKDGKFAFNDLFPIDTAQFKIQAHNKSGKSFNVGIEIFNQFKPPVFSANGSVMPWYVNTDSLLLNNSAIKAQQQQARANLLGEGHTLKEVVINGKKSVKNSKNLNGAGEADQIMDEQDMLKAGKMTLGDMLKEKVRGFNIGEFPRLPKPDKKPLPPRLSYRDNEKEIRLIFDGIDVEKMAPQIEGEMRDDKDRLEYIKQFLDFYTAEDIKGIEVMFNSQYNSSYGAKFLTTEQMTSPKYPIEMDWTFVEITTRSGKGPIMKTTPGTYLYKPLAFTMPKEFYRPRYTYRNNVINMGTDLRSTIHWAPQVVTDANGKAVVSFYSADKAASYTATVEGTDLKGTFGYGQGKVVITPASNGGQVNGVPPKMLSAISDMWERFPIEKVYLQLDKPYYSSGDTIRFKAYLVNGDFLKPSTRSGLLYLELDDGANMMVKRIMISLTSGVGWGNLPLDEEIREGSYTLRATTKWMLNFGEDYIFKKTIYVSPVNAGTALISAGYKLQSIANRNTVSSAVKLTSLTGDPIRLKAMRLQIQSGYRLLFNDKMNTGMDGRFQFNFNIPDKTETNNLYIRMQNLGKGNDTATLMVPIVLNRPEKTDVQFMPEGGHIVAGIATKIGFKAISEDGKGIDISGRIVNSKQQEVATFKATHKGMGSFELTPQAGETYTARVALTNTTTKDYPLPAISLVGTTLRVTSKGKDSLEITVKATPGAAISTYYLVGQTRGMIHYGNPINLKNTSFKKVIPKSLFPTGISHFTLFNNTNQPLNERIIYVDHNDNLQISLTPTKKDYGIRDSIAVNVMVKDEDGNPVQGNFSLAVTDASQVHTDSTNNMVSNLLLTSDLKGNVEEPGWYFYPDSYQDKTTTTSATKAVALDNLLLTQGWIGYDWKAIFNPVVQQPEHLAEKEFAVSGSLTNVFNKPIKQTNVRLLQKDPLYIKDILTDNNGRFIFKSNKLQLTDSSFFLIQAKSKNDRDINFNIGITVDQFDPPMFSFPKERQFPWFFNTDTSLLNNVGIKMAQLKAEADYRGEGRMLKEVSIKSTKLIPDSHNLNGPGGSDMAMDEKEMNADKNMTLFELLQHKFKGTFHKTKVIRRYGESYNSYYFDYAGCWTGKRGVILRIDGVFAGTERMMEGGLKASDIKGVELMTSYNLGLPYALAARMLNYNPDCVCFLEITTYSDHGANLIPTPGRYTYRPIPVSLPEQFYRPRYTVKNSSIAMGTDLRSTIHWEPNVITDKDGKATVSFFSADMPTDYNLILEGTDLNGGFGYGRQKIKVGLKTISPK